MANGRTSRSVDESIVRMSGRPNYLGTIDFTGTSKTNHQATTPFNNTGTALMGKILLLQPDADVYILPVLSNSAAVTSSIGVKLSAGERVILTFGDLSSSLVAGEYHGWLAALQVSAGGNLKIWELL